MEFKSDEFIRNIEIEKEKAELNKRADALESEKKASVVQTDISDISLDKSKPMPNNSFNDEPVLVDIKNQEPEQLDDIRLSPHNMDTSNQESKKKYLILSGSLIVLFVLTIIIIRLMSQDEDEAKLFVNNVEQIKEEKIFDTKDANAKYQELIDKKTKQTIQKELDIETIAKKEIPLPKEEESITNEEAATKIIEESRGDVFGMETTTNIPKHTVKDLINTLEQNESSEPIQVNDQIEVEEPKKIIKPKKQIKPVKEIKQPKVKPVKTVKKISPSLKEPKRLTGTFVQIGAFSKPPSKTLLNKITRAGYGYKIHKMVIKGTLYNKVLIGPYKNKTEATKYIARIKKDLKINSTYILRLK